MVKMENSSIINPKVGTISEHTRFMTHNYSWIWTKKRFCTFSFIWTVAGTGQFGCKQIVLKTYELSKLFVQFMDCFFGIQGLLVTNCVKILIEHLVSVYQNEVKPLLNFVWCWLKQQVEFQLGMCRPLLNDCLEELLWRTLVLMQR